MLYFFFLLFAGVGILIGITVFFAFISDAIADSSDSQIVTVLLVGGIITLVTGVSATTKQTVCIAFIGYCW